MCVLRTFSSSDEEQSCGSIESVRHDAWSTDSSQADADAVWIMMHQGHWKHNTGNAIASREAKSEQGETIRYVSQTVPGHQMLSKFSCSDKTKKKHDVSDCPMIWAFSFVGIAHCTIFKLICMCITKRWVVHTLIKNELHRAICDLRHADFETYACCLLLG